MRQPAQVNNLGGRLFFREVDVFKTTSVHDPNQLSTLLRLQILVLVLGQAKHFGWWKSEFLSSTGLRYLERIYPRDFFWAAVRSSAAAAKDAHDNAIGVKDAFHLFRLPRSVANRLPAIMASNYSTLEKELAPILDEQSQLLTLLKAFTENARRAIHVGPMRIGSEKDLARPETIAQIAFLYHSAFQRNFKTYPYFEQVTRRR